LTELEPFPAATLSRGMAISRWGRRRRTSWAGQWTRRPRPRRTARRRPRRRRRPGWWRTGTGPRWRAASCSKRRGLVPRRTSTRSAGAVGTRTRRPQLSSCSRRSLLPCERSMSTTTRTTNGVGFSLRHKGHTINFTFPFYL
jgi:hypothetical protein